jgi:hypothetical protein
LDYFSDFKILSFPIIKNNSLLCFIKTKKASHFHVRLYALPSVRISNQLIEDAKKIYELKEFIDIPYIGSNTNKVANWQYK